MQPILAGNFRDNMAPAILVEKVKLKKPPLGLAYLGDKVLRQSSKRITQINQEIRDLSRKMLQTMYSSDGIGLAGPQVGVNKQILVVDIHPDEAANPPLILINPVIRDYGDEIELGQEGCLSIPGVFLDVKRPEMIELAYKDEQGRPQVLFASGLLARVIQHEMDHLEGIMFVDRVDNQMLLNQELVKQGFAKHMVKAVPSKRKSP
jgi:peptide deformylase